jgi:ABC-type nitrate/sulfonate/bicarbonate transport system permease component
MAITGELGLIGRRSLAPNAGALFRLTARRRGQLRQLGFVIASLGIGLICWEVLSYVIVGPFLIPPPQAVARALVPMSESGDLLRDIGMSLSRVATGYVAGVTFALLLGLFMGRIRLLHDLLDPMLEFMRYLSPTALIPVVVVWFGIGEFAKYYLVFWGTIFAVLLNTIAGVKQTPMVRQHAALCLGASQAQIFRLIVLPSAVPYIVVGMRIALASAFVSIIPAELLAAGSGLGYLLQQSSLLLQTDRMFVALLTICTVGFLADRLFQFLVMTLCRRYLAVV